MEQADAEFWVEVLTAVRSVAPTAVAVLVVAGVLFLTRKVFDRLEERGRARRFTSQMTLLGLTVAGLIVVVLSLKIDPAAKSNLLTLIGIVLSAAIALSATTVLGNILAGLMIRSLRRLHTGDFVETEGHFGRITELGLLFTEIQAQDSTLWQIPNLYLVQRPLQIVRSQGTLVTADVSLGYDVPRKGAREALHKAVEHSGLEEPFVLVVELGDFSVTYRCGGLLREVKSLVSTKSSLRGSMLDALHDAGIEIASPTLMITRALEPEQRILPPVDRSPAPEEDEEVKLESIAFEKADAAEVVDALRQQMATLMEQRRELAEQAKAARKEAKEGGEGEAPALEQSLEKVDRRLERLRTMIEAQSSQLED